ncbi:MAG: DUF3352 domain-containing protein [Leptolyngbyaceae cyanobacterium CRU_2_3]|nr:DUF3352 domain-containing protein [Leptolyngbyaceae cyanobacterium CRU_2_3]
MIDKLFKKQKTAVLLVVGSATGLLVGGAIAWWSLQRPAIGGLPTGSDIIPEDVAITLSFSTNEGQWRQLRQMGTPETEAALNKHWMQLRDRLLTANGLNYERDIKPWVGSEITVAFLAPGALNPPANLQQIQPYTAASLQGDTAAVLVLPIANVNKAQAVLAQPKIGAGQEWVDRDYQGIKIREVQGKTERAYAAAVLGDRYLVASSQGQAIEQVIDTFKGKPSVARTSGYGPSFAQIKTTTPLLRAYVNVPVASVVASHNADQPFPPQGLALLQGNKGLVSAMDLEPEGVRVQAITWLPADSKVRYSAQNTAGQMPSLLPDSTLLMTSGSNFKQTWENYSQAVADSGTGGVLNPSFIRQGFNNLTGMNFDKDLVPWMDGEFSLALISDPGNATATDTVPASAAKAGVLLLAQTGDRQAADAAFKTLDGVMRDRYQFRVNDTQLGGKPAVAWISPFSSLTATRGWLDGNIAFLAIGADVGSVLVPAPTQTLATNLLFSGTASPSLLSNNGHFFIATERFADRHTRLPLPTLPAANQSYVTALRALHVTAASPDARTIHYDVHVLLRKVSNPPATAPSPQVDTSLEVPPAKGVTPSQPPQPSP